MNKERFIIYLQIITPLITVGTVIFACISWCNLMNGIPKRVETLETKVDTIEKTLEANMTKTDLILNSVYRIQDTLLRYSK